MTSIRLVLTTLALMGCFCARTAAAQTTAALFLNVSDFGAQGNAKTDNTDAFQRAMDQCAATGGGIVSVATGRYLIKGRLNIPASVTLEGVWRFPPTVNQYHNPADSKRGPELTGSVLLAVADAGTSSAAPFIELNTNSCIKGITIFYPDQTKTNPPVPYPWTVQSAGADNCSIIDVLMVNPYMAVDFATNTSGRHFIRNLYAQALYRGLAIDKCLDVGRVENVHFWPFWTAADGDSPVAKFTIQQGEAFTFGRSDWEYVSNCFAINYAVGMRFVKIVESGPTAGGGNYLLSQSGADLCPIAVKVDDCQGHSGISFSNSQIFGDVIVEKSNSGMVRFDSCGLFGSTHGTNQTASVRTDGRGRVSFSNCHFYCIQPGNKGSAVINALGGRLSVSGCAFINSEKTADIANPGGITLARDVIAAVITGNEFYGKARIDNQAKGKVVISDNVEGTDE